MIGPVDVLAIRFVNLSSQPILNGFVGSLDRVSLSMVIQSGSAVYFIFTIKFWNNLFLNCFSLSDQITSGTSNLKNISFSRNSTVFSAVALTDDLVNTDLENPSIQTIANICFRYFEAGSLPIKSIYRVCSIRIGCRYSPVGTLVSSFECFNSRQLSKIWPCILLLATVEDRMYIWCLPPIFACSFLIQRAFYCRGGWG